MKSLSRSLIVAFALITGCALAANAQQTIATDLLSPTKVIFTSRGNLLIAEAGNGPNTGRVSFVNRTTGARRTVIDHLPSGFDYAEGAPSPSGPSGLALQGNTLYVLIAQGDSVLAGPNVVQGSVSTPTQLPNPQPSSLLLSSIIAVQFGSSIDDTTANLSLSAADQIVLKGQQEVVRGSGSDQITARLVVDFADYRQDPIFGSSSNVQASDPYGLAIIGDTIYVADAGWNSIRKVSINGGTVSDLVVFPQVSNTTGVGPLTIDAVPDSIRVYQGQLLVTLLTGFPFPTGASSVVSVDPDSGAVTTGITGLTTAIDVAPLDTDTTPAYVVAQFSSNLLADAPGMITLHQLNHARVTVVSSIVSPSSLVVDSRSGEIFVTEISTGQLVRIDAAETLPTSPASVIPVIASVSGAIGSRFETSMQLTNPSPVAASGSLIFHTADGTASIFRYQLDPFQTKSYVNVFSSASVPAGAASIDVAPAVGAVPRAVVRIFDTSRNTSSTGTVIDQVAAADILHTGDSGVLLTGADSSVSRTNIGVRALGSGATVQYFLYHADGTLVSQTTQTLTPNQLLQLPVGQLFPSVGITENNTVVVYVSAGAAIPYAAIVNNVTQEMSFQRATRTEQ